MVTWYLWIKMTERDQEIVAALFLLFPSSFCHEDLFFFVMHLNYFTKRLVFF